jgi:hypothetical protein
MDTDSIGLSTTILDNPDILFAVGLAVVATIVAVGKLIERVCRPPSAEADK